MMLDDRTSRDWWGCIFDWVEIWYIVLFYCSGVVSRDGVIATVASLKMGWLIGIECVWGWWMGPFSGGGGELVVLELDGSWSRDSPELYQSVVELLLAADEQREKGRWS